MAGRVHFSVTALSCAANGRKLPSLTVLLAYVRACEGDEEEWAARWREVAEPAPEQPEPVKPARPRRRRVPLAAAFAVLMVLAGAGFTTALDARQRQVQTETRMVASEVRELRTTDPWLAARLSLAAYRLAPGEETRGVLLDSYVTPRGPRLTGHTANVNTAAFHGSGELVTASWDGTAKLWDTATSREAGTVARHGRNVNGAAFSPDGRLVATASWDRTVRLWRVGDSTERAVLAGHADDVNAVAFNADGGVLASASTDRTVRLWDTGTFREIGVLTGHEDGVVSVAFSPAGLIATASFDRRVGLWHNGVPTFLEGHGAPVTWVAFSPDGRLLASASQDNTVRLWDVATGRELAVLAGHKDIVRSVAFSPDGRLLASASLDRTTRLWDVAGRSPITMLHGHTGAVVSVAFSADGRTIATASDDDTVLLWPVPEGDAEAWVCAHTPPLSRDEWQRYFPGVAFAPPCR